MNPYDLTQDVAFQRFDLLNQPPTPPDLLDAKYVRCIEQQADFGKLNGWPRALRCVTVTAMDLTIDEKDKYELLKFTDQDDLREIYLIADSLTVNVELKFPQTRVVIVARQLNFGENGRFDTTPKNSTYRDPSSINGDPGDKGGDIILLCDKVVSDGKVHFRTRGSTGQAADEGGYGDAPTRKFLPPLTQADWNKLFTLTHRTVDHELATAVGPTFYTSILPLPSWDEFHNNFGDTIVYAAITNTAYVDAFHSSQTKRKTVASVGTLDGPGTGGDAKLPGKPGVGGAGGNIVAAGGSLAAAMCDLQGGASGNRHPAVAGGAGGTPEVCNYLYWDGHADGKEHHFNQRQEQKFATKGKPSPEGPEAESKTGPNGKLLSLPLNDAWAMPPLMGIVIQFARDCISSNASDLATKVLEPYVKAVPPALDVVNKALEPVTKTLDVTNPLEPVIIGWKLNSGVLGTAVSQQQLANELTFLSEQLKTHFDIFGNPPGWVPSLSLQSTVSLYKSVVESSLQQIYTAYVLEKLWNDKADKSAAVAALIDGLGINVSNAQSAMSDARGQLKPAIDDLAQLVKQIERIAKALRDRQQELSNSADHKVMTDQQKDAVAAGFKISGAILKALPLPEPYQAAAGAVGTVFDITSTFISSGGNDTAFDSLKTQVTAFTGDDGPMKTLTSDLDDDLKANSRAAKDADTAAAVAKAKQDSSDQSITNTVSDLTTQKAKAEAAQKAREARLKFDKREGTLSAVTLADLDRKLATANSELTESKKLSVKSTQDQALKKADLDQAKAKLENQKADREATIKTRVGQLKNITASVVTIGKTMNQLMVSQSQLNSAYDKALAAIENVDETFVSLMREATYLQQKKADMSQRVVQIATTLRVNEEQITKSLMSISELRGQKANSDAAMDPSALTYIQALGQDAHRDLKRYLYYVVKAFEYYMVQPWDQSYLTAQKTFEDLRRILDPADITFKFDDDPTNDKQKKLKDLINKPNLQRANLLSVDDMDLLKIVYQKPLRDMGKKLADGLATGSGRLETTPKPVSLKGAIIDELNGNLLDDKRPNLIDLSLVKLRQIDQKVERQRIVGIKVVAATCKSLSGQMPDQITFTIALDGQSIVRANNRLYAFDPEVKVGQGGTSLPGAIFTTYGGNRGNGWVPATGEPGFMSVTDKALWQPDSTAQENLLASLMSDNTADGKGLLDLSQFRPGIFSDFVLAVDVKPAGVQVQFGKIDLEISVEKGDTNLNSLLLSVENNLSVAIPIEISQADSSGREGGEGDFIRIYNDAKKFSADPILVTAPESFGTHPFLGWSVDGNQTLKTNVKISVSKDTFLTAKYGYPVVAGDLGSISGSS